jgi:tRNA threonylcarbamoyl adenosine modification protein YeaZ/ribosomal-protein-alanine acetyltransferase
VSGLVLETATEHVDVLVVGDDGETLARRVEDVGHGHTRRLSALVRDSLAEAGVAPNALDWIASDLGPGSFTGVRVGLATAEALSLVARAPRRGASSLAALAHGVAAARALVVPLVPAGRRDVYAGFFRADARGRIALLAAPEVGPIASVLERVDEARRLVPRSRVRFVGPAVARERLGLEAAHPGSTEPLWRTDGLSAEDLARAVRSDLGPAAGLPPRGTPGEPVYVRPAQAEERVRRRVSAETPIQLRPFRAQDIAEAAEIERQIFTDPWPASFFAGELGTAQVHARIADRGGRLAGYSLAWLGPGEGHLGNLAVVAGERRRGVAGALLEDLLREARARGVERVTLEVRVSNFAAQGLYRRHGFRLAGLRRRYYRDTGEDALIMQWTTTGESAREPGS